MSQRGPVLGVDVAQVSTVDEFGVGTKARHEGTEYVWAQAAGTIAAKTAVYFAGLGTWQATASGNAGRVEGVNGSTALSVGQYAWFAVSGYVANAVVSTNIAANDFLSAIAGSSGEIQEIIAVAEGGSATHAVGTLRVIGVALEDDTAGVGDILLYGIL